MSIGEGQIGLSAQLKKQITVNVKRNEFCL